MTSNQKLDAVVLLLERELNRANLNLRAQTSLSNKDHRYYSDRKDLLSSLLSQVQEIISK